MASFFMSVAQNHHPSFMVEINKTFFRIILQALLSWVRTMCFSFLVLSPTFFGCALLLQLVLQLVLCDAVLADLWLNFL